MQSQGQAIQLSLFRTQTNQAQKQKERKFQMIKQEIKEILPKHWEFKQLVSRYYLTGSNVQFSVFNEQNQTVVQVNLLEREEKIYYTTPDKFSANISLVKDISQNGTTTQIYPVRQISYFPGFWVAKQIKYAPRLRNLSNPSLQFKCVCIIKGNIRQKASNLNSDCQKAILAYQIIYFISKIDSYAFYSSRQTQSIKDRLVKHIRSKFATVFKNKNSINKVLQCFEESILYDTNIFNQDRFQQSTTLEERLTYFPTFVTQEIFEFVINLDKSTLTSFIYGAAGVGKSHSISLFHHLFEFIEIFYSQESLSAIHNFISVISFAKKVPKFFYYSFGKHTTIQSFINTILRQVKIVYSNEKQHQLKQFIQKKDWIKVIKTIIQLYNQKKIHAVFLIDQINFYYSKLRDDYQGSQKRIIQQLQIILILLKDASVQTVYSSSLNKQVLSDIVKQAQRKAIKIIPQVSKQITWPSYGITPTGFYETLHFIKFQQVRLITYNFSQCIQAMAHRIKQIEGDFGEIFKFKKLIYLNQYFDFPITPLTIRQYLSSEYRYTNRLLIESQTHCQRSLSEIDNYVQVNYDIERSLKEFCKMLKKFVFSSIIKDYQKFIYNGNQQYSSRKMVILFQLLQNAKQKDRYQHRCQTKEFTLQIQQIANQYANSWKTDKKNLIRSLEKNLFYQSETTGKITLHFSPKQLCYILKQAIFSFPNQNQVYIMIILHKAFQKSEIILGQFFDKIFSKVVSEYQFQLDINKTIYKIKNSQRYPRFFQHFLKESHQRIRKIKEQKDANQYQQILKQEQNKRSFQDKDKHRSYSKNKNNEVKVQQEKSEKKQSVRTQQEAKQFIRDHFKDLLTEQLDTLGDDQWFGAAPKDSNNQNFGKDISGESPSFDFVLARRDKNKNYILRTFDYSFGKGDVRQLEERFEKAQYFLNEIEKGSNQTNNPQLLIKTYYTILVSSKLKSQFQTIKKKKKKQKYFFNQKLEVQSLQQITFFTKEKTVQFQCLNTILQFMKQKHPQMIIHKL